jgi:hypothetical protein
MFVRLMFVRRLIVGSLAVFLLCPPPVDAATKPSTTKKRRSVPTTRPSRPRVVDMCDVLGRVDAQSVMGRYATADRGDRPSFAGGREIQTRLPFTTCRWEWSDTILRLTDGSPDVPPDPKEAMLSVSQFLVAENRVFANPELFEPVTVSGVSYPLRKDVGALNSIMSNKARCAFMLTHPKGTFMTIIEYFGYDAQQAKTCRPSDYTQTEELLRQTVKVLDSGQLEYLN